MPNEVWKRGHVADMVNRKGGFILCKQRGGKNTLLLQGVDLENEEIEVDLIEEEKEGKC